MELNFDYARNQNHNKPNKMCSSFFGSAFFLYIKNYHYICMFFLFSRRNKEVERMGENRDKLKVAAGHSQKSKNYWFICYGFIIHPQHNPLRDNFYNKITKITTAAPETAANRKQTSFNNYYSIFTERYEPLIIKINGRENLSSICRKIQQNSSDLNLPKEKPKL